MNLFSFFSFYFFSFFFLFFSLNIYVCTFIPSMSRPWSLGSWIYNYLCNQCRSPLMLWVRISIRPRCATLCDKVCQLLATGRWFSSVSSTNKTDRHDITEWLKVAFNTTRQANNNMYYRYMYKSMYLFLLFFFSF
jgi:hypothetical protein